jgi:glyoxylase-like metal-dependent hydrolase (beta-lactamase superfamily II)
LTTRLSTVDSGPVIEADPRRAWLEPGAHEVAPGVWRMPLPLPTDGLRAVNVYAVADGGGLTLVDAGWAIDEARQALVTALRAIGAQLGDIRRFLVTHFHRDHLTQAIAIRRELGAKVLLGAGEKHAVDTLIGDPAPAMRHQFEMLARYGGEKVLAALRAAGMRADVGDPGYEPPDAYVDSGELFQVGDRVLEAIATPGHTRGHLVFFDRAGGLLFAGDHVLPHITPSVGFEVDPPRLALDAYLGSLRLVRRLPDAVLLPAHGPAGGRVHERVDALLDHHDRRLAEMLRRLGDGASTPYEVAAQTFWTSRRRPLGDLDPVNQMLAVFETALHLDLLVARGKVALADADGVLVYRAGAGASR